MAKRVRISQKMLLILVVVVGIIVYLYKTSENFQTNGSAASICQMLHMMESNTANAMAVATTFIQSAQKNLLDSQGQLDITTKQLSQLGCNTTKFMGAYNFFNMFMSNNCAAISDHYKTVIQQVNVATANVSRGQANITELNNQKQTIANKLQMANCNTNQFNTPVIPSTGGPFPDPSTCVGSHLAAGMNLPAATAACSPAGVGPIHV